MTLEETYYIVMIFASLLAAIPYIISKIIQHFTKGLNFYERAILLLLSDSLNTIFDNGLVYVCNNGGVWNLGFGKQRFFLSQINKDGKYDYMYEIYSKFAFNLEVAILSLLEKKIIEEKKIFPNDNMDCRQNIKFTNNGWLSYNQMLIKKIRFIYLKYLLKYIYYRQGAKIYFNQDNFWTKKPITKKPLDTDAKV